MNIWCMANESHHRFSQCPRHFPAMIINGAISSYFEVFICNCRVDFVALCRADRENPGWLVWKITFKLLYTNCRSILSHHGGKIDHRGLENHGRGELGEMI